MCYSPKRSPNLYTTWYCIMWFCNRLQVYTYLLLIFPPPPVPLWSPALELLMCQDCALHWLCIVSMHNSLCLFWKTPEIGLYTGKNIIPRKQVSWVQVPRIPLTSYMTLDNHVICWTSVSSSVKLVWSPLLCLSHRVIARISQHPTLVPLTAFMSLCFNCLFTYLYPLLE